MYNNTIYHQLEVIYMINIKPSAAIRKIIMRFPVFVSAWENRFF